MHAAKFNELVPGTCYGVNYEPTLSESLSTDSDEHKSNITSTNISDTYSTVESTDPDSENLLTYSVILSSFVAFLLFMVIVLCIILTYCCLTNKKSTKRRYVCIICILSLARKH